MSRRCKDLLPGGLASGRCPSDFDPRQLAMGIEVELEHTGDRRIAREIAEDHLAEFPDYYTRLSKMEEEAKRGYLPNRSRVRTVDAEELARDMRERFHASPVTKKNAFRWDWPEQFQHVGDSLAIAYSSDKWKANGDLEAYKHLAESPNVALALPSLFARADRPSERWPVRGPMVSFLDVPLPEHFAELGLFEEADLRLFTGGSDTDPSFGEHDDDGCVALAVRYGHVAGSYLRWSVTHGKADQPFLFVYTDREGPLLIVLGESLDVQKDGIVG